MKSEIKYCCVCGSFNTKTCDSCFRQSIPPTTSLPKPTALLILTDDLNPLLNLCSSEDEKDQLLRFINTNSVGIVYKMDKWRPPID